MTSVERVVARVLLWGGVLSIGLMVVGLSGYSVRGGLRGETLNVERLLENRAHGRAADVFISIRGIRRGLAQWPAAPVALTALGIVILFVTPALAVALALLTFARSGDVRYVSIAMALLVALCLSFFFGTG